MLSLKLLAMHARHGSAAPATRPRAHALQCGRPYQRSACRAVRAACMVATQHSEVQRISELPNTTCESFTFTAESGCQVHVLGVDHMARQQDLGALHLPGVWITDI